MVTAEGNQATLELRVIPALSVPCLQLCNELLRSCSQGKSRLSLGVRGLCNLSMDG